MDIAQHPISRVVWLDPNELQANAYNPNFVQAQEFVLLKTSLMAQGWIQPILANQEPGSEIKEIIDGFHRWTLSRTDKDIWNLADGRVPVVMFNLPVADRMLLTVRINRAKGSHTAFKMHEVVHALHNEHGLSVEAIGRGIGADKFEVETLLAKNVFEKKGVHVTPYSRSWIPEINKPAKVK